MYSNGMLMMSSLDAPIAKRDIAMGLVFTPVIPQDLQVIHSCLTATTDTVAGTTTAYTIYSNMITNLHHG